MIGSVKILSTGLFFIAIVDVICLVAITIDYLYQKKKDRKENSEK